MLTMNKRIFVEKKADFQIKAQALLKELRHQLQLKTLVELRIVQVYDVFHLDQELLLAAIKHVFSEQVTDQVRSEEHTSELQSRQYLVCRLLLEKKKKKKS